MTIADRANSPESQTSEPSTDLNNPENLNFWEPEEEQANSEQSADGIERETDETIEDDGQESDEPAVEATEEEEPEDEGSEPEEVVITLKGGEQVKLEELKLGYMRERDYRHKTQDVATKGRNLEEMTTRVTRTVDALASFLAEQLPSEPSPALAMQNPSEYTRQKAMYDAAFGQINQIIAMGNEPKSVAQALAKEQRDQILQSENENLVQSFPQTATADGRKKFFEQAFDTARELGFADEEMAGQTDHRLFKLVHYARLGLQAEKAKGVALSKVQNAPSVVPKAKAKGIASQQARQNQDAMKKLSRTGSIKDAMNINFD